MTPGNKKSKTEPNVCIQHEIDHYRQQYNWDCGVACVLMLLPLEERDQILQNFMELCQEEGFGQSTWTIDLCYLLKRFGIRHCMHTSVLGVNEDNRRHKYYDKIINLDYERVQRRFDDASSVGIEVVESSLTMNDIINHLVRHGPVILLVDAGLLACDLCKHNKLKVEFRTCFGGSYTGHYILLVGYRSGPRSKVLYRDPALSARLCAATPRALDVAHRASGTDRDLILLYPPRDRRIHL